MQIKRPAEFPPAVKALVDAMAPETLALVQAINSDRTTKDSFGGYLNVLAGCDTPVEKRMLLVCLIACPETNLRGLRYAARILGPHFFGLDEPQNGGVH